MVKSGEDEQALRRWFYQRAGRLHGPMTIRELQASVVLGFVGQDDLVQERLQGRWTTAAHADGSLFLFVKSCGAPRAADAAPP